MRNRGVGANVSGVGGRCTKSQLGRGTCCAALPPPPFRRRPLPSVRRRSRSGGRGRGPLGLVVSASAPRSTRRVKWGSGAACSLALEWVAACSSTNRQHFSTHHHPLEPEPLEQRHGWAIGPTGYSSWMSVRKTGSGGDESTPTAGSALSDFHEDDLFAVATPNGRRLRA